MKPLPETSQAKDALSTSNDAALKEVCPKKAEAKVQAWWQEADDAKATVACQYVWGARPGHRDELILRDRNTGSSSSEDFDERLWSLMDYYDPTSTVNPEGEVVERYQFSAFGQRSILTPDFSPRPTSLYAWDFGFKGQFLDVDTGYYNYGYRYYSAELGRWLSRDPIGEKGGDNLYEFTDNNPPSKLDQLGLIAFGWIPVEIHFCLFISPPGRYKCKVEMRPKLCPKNPLDLAACLEVANLAWGTACALQSHSAIVSACGVFKYCYDEYY